ncbi:hypothetical protein RFI_40321, partial [Reticulomyxa filosa]
FFTLFTFLLVFVKNVKHCTRIVWNIVAGNPFRVLLIDPNKFEKVRKPGEQPENKTQKTDFVIRYCSNGHSFFVKKCQSYHKEIKCPDPWCNALIKKVDTTPNTQTVIEYVDTAKRFLFCLFASNYKT